MMLRYMKLGEHAGRVEKAVLQTIADRKVRSIRQPARSSAVPPCARGRLMPSYVFFRSYQVLTGDLGGSAKCSEFTKAVCDRVAATK